MLADQFTPPRAAIELPAAGRAAFLRKTYLNLLLAVLAFAGIDAAIFLLVPADTLISTTAFVTSGWMWLLVLGAFMAVSYGAEAMARRATAIGAQYAAMGVSVMAWSLIFVPLLVMAVYFAGPMVLPVAAGLTGLVFIGLTAFVFMTGINFQFMRGVLVVGGLAAGGAIVVSILFGFTLGIWFTALMIAFAGASVLYNTSQVLHDYREDQHVSAALGLFASVALLFWYILRLVLAMGRN